MDNKKLYNIILNNILKPSLKSKGASAEDLILNWEKILGNNISSLCSLKKINWSNNTAHIIISTNNIYSLQNLLLQKQEIINRLNEYFGYFAVKKLDIVNK